jgi:hypothetical protein
MATFAQLGQLVTQNPTEFQSRVNYAMCVAAINVYAEGTGVTGHAARAAFSTRVLTGNFNLIGACFAVLTNPTISAEATLPAQGQPPNGNGIPDSDIQFAVNSIWNALAGA